MATHNGVRVFANLEDDTITVETAGNNEQELVSSRIRLSPDEAVALRDALNEAIEELTN